ncbi:MAG: hypothetical protein KIT48_07975 [Pseudolabrys sp.]|nr:hypothetical protein [Pseudolabrys sp.]
MLLIASPKAARAEAKWAEMMFESKQSVTVECSRATGKCDPATAQSTKEDVQLGTLNFDGAVYRFTPLDSEDNLVVHRCAVGGRKGYVRDGVTFECAITKTPKALELAVKYRFEPGEGSHDQFWIVNFPLSDGPCTALYREIYDGEREPNLASPTFFERRYSGRCSTVR